MIKIIKYIQNNRKIILKIYKKNVALNNITFVLRRNSYLDLVIPLIPDDNF